MQYRAVKVNVDMQTITEAREWIKKSFNEDNIIQHDNHSDYFDLFKDLNNEKTIHPHYKLLKESDFYSSAKEVIKEISYHYKDIDGNFIDQFQSLNGFDSRIFELYLFCFFREQSFSFKRDFEAPDFIVNKMDNEIAIEAANYILEFTEKYNMTFPGWEPERMAKLDELFKAYAPVTKEKLWDNLKYFLEAIMPTCRECDIKMAIHQDDPPWDIFGLPRLLVDAESIDRFLTMVDDPYNCLTLCSGSMNANPNNNVAAIVRKHCDRIPFAHVRNIHHFENGDFSEAAHRDCCGETGIIEILRAYHDCGFDGCIRPDHGRQLWEEGPGNCRPGYGKYDRALGVQYMLGVWDLLDRLDEEKSK